MTKYIYIMELKHKLVEKCWMFVDYKHLYKPEFIDLKTDQSILIGKNLELRWTVVKYLILLVVIISIEWCG